MRLERGDEPEARALAESALDEAVELGMLGIQAVTRLQRARVWIAIGREDELAPARDEIEHAEALARERGLQILLADAQALRAKLAKREGDEIEHARARDEAVRNYRRCGDQLAADRAKAIG